MAAVGGSAQGAEGYSGHFFPHKSEEMFHGSLWGSRRAGVGVGEDKADGGGFDGYKE